MTRNQASFLLVVGTLCSTLEVRADEIPDTEIPNVPDTEIPNVVVALSCAEACQAEPAPLSAGRDGETLQPAPILGVEACGKNPFSDTLVPLCGSDRGNDLVPVVTVITKECPSGQDCRIDEDDQALLEEHYKMIEPDRYLFGLASTGKATSISEPASGGAAFDEMSLEPTPGQEPLEADGGEGISDEQLLEQWWGVATGASVVVPQVAGLLGGFEPATDGLLPIRVAVIDSGIERGVLPGGEALVLEDGWSAPGVCTDPGDGDPNGAEPPCHLQDPLGHGTSVADLALLYSGQTTRLLSIRVLDDEGRGSLSGLTEGILRAVLEYDALLLNLSLGFELPEATESSSASERATLPWFLAAALDTAYRSGARVFAAAGNRTHFARASSPLFYPAAALETQRGEKDVEYQLHVTSVSGLGPGGMASSQVIGTLPETGSAEEPDDLVDFWAPSEFICTRTAGTSMTSNGLWRLSGSSFAVPQVVGALGLFLTLECAMDPDTCAGVDAGSAIDRLGPALLQNGRLDLCNAYEQLVTLEPASGGQEGDPGTLAVCEAWEEPSATLGPSPDLCTEEYSTAPPFWSEDYWTTMEPIQLPSYPPSFGFVPEGGEEETLSSAAKQTVTGDSVDGASTGESTSEADFIIPSDQGVAATWSSGVSSSPGRPICTSCEYCRTAPPELTLFLRRVPAFFKDVQIRIALEDGTQAYIPLTGLEDELTQLWEDDHGALLERMDLLLEFGDSDQLPIHEVWIIGRDRATDEWSGQPMMRTTAC